MARITIEDCKKYINNRFELVILAAQRAKDLSLGAPALVQKNNDKDPVLALREIAKGALDCNKMREVIVNKCKQSLLYQQKIQGKQISQDDMNEILQDLASDMEKEDYDDEIIDGYEHEHEDEYNSDDDFDLSLIDDEDEHMPVQNIEESKVFVDVTYDDIEVLD
jgi:DNA-directed RNA polymerase subunit omega